MKRIGILTAGGDTPALNATIYGAVMRACDWRVQVVGFIKGFSSLFNPSVPHLILNPLFLPIPEVDAARGGTILGSSRDYVDPNDKENLDLIAHRLEKLGIEGLICVGGDGTLNGMQALAEYLPTVLSPKTIDNDLGLNYLSEPDEWQRVRAGETGEPDYVRRSRTPQMHLDRMINYVTPGYPTSVFVSADGVGRIRTTAESHRRIAIIEVMGRHSGYLALGTAYGRPDLILIPESPLNLPLLVERVKEIYERQKHVVIVAAEGIVDQDNQMMGAEYSSRDPAGNVILSGAAENLRHKLIQAIGDDYFVSKRRAESARAAIFTRKVGHTQRGGRPIAFDRFHGAELGGKAVDMLMEGQSNAVATLQYSQKDGFTLDSFSANTFLDRWGRIHAREMHPSFYDAENMKPSAVGIDYLLPIFDNAVSHDDVEFIRQTIFNPNNLLQPFHSVNVDIDKRIRRLNPPV